MIRPFITYLKNFLSAGRVLGSSQELQSLAGADALLQELVLKGNIPGLSITVLKDGKTWLQKGYGYANIMARIPVDPLKTYFRTASVSKPIAATALLRLVEEGQMALDASFYEYVPYFPRKAYDFTIRQLAGHTAGFRGYRGKEYSLNKPYGIKESLKLFQDDALLFKPGTAYHYNSFDWVLLSLAMQEVCGMPFADLVADKVLLPLGMKHTLPEIPGGEPSKLATFYTRQGGVFRQANPVNNQYKLAGGGYLSSSADIARLGQAYLDGAIGDPNLRAEFLTPGYIGSTPTWYGLGWEVSRDLENRPFYGHTGNSIGAYSMFRVYPDPGIVLAVLVNCSNPGIEAELQEFLGFIPSLGGEAGIIGI